MKSQNDMRAFMDALSGKHTVSRSTFPLTLKVSPSLLDEFAECEYGAHEDGQRSDNEGTQYFEYGISAYEILKRHTTKLEIRNASEADLIYYAACSGTFALQRKENARDDATRLRAANRIADFLRAYATRETVTRWRSADGY